VRLQPYLLICSAQRKPQQLPVAERHPPEAEQQLPVAERHPPEAEQQLPVAERHPPEAEQQLPVAERHPPEAKLQLERGPAAAARPSRLKWQAHPLYHLRLLIAAVSNRSRFLTLMRRSHVSIWFIALNYPDQISPKVGPRVEAPV
jgi:hypothetical protein